MTISFFVEGVPKPGGSKTGFWNRKANRVIMAPACKGTKAWMDAVAIEAQTKGSKPFDGPVKLSIVFVMPRPKCHFKKDGSLKSNAPDWHVKTPDLTKLVRSTEDALKGICWRDDCQVVMGDYTKRFACEGELTGAWIWVKPI